MMNELRCKRISHPPVEKDGFRILADMLQPFHEKRFSANAIDRESFFCAKLCLLPEKMFFCKLHVLYQFHGAEVVAVLVPHSHVANQHGTAPFFHP